MKIAAFDISVHTATMIISAHIDMHAKEHRHADKTHACTHHPTTNPRAIASRDFQDLFEHELNKEAPWVESAAKHHLSHVVGCMSGGENALKHTPHCRSRAPLGIR